MTQKSIWLPLTLLIALDLTGCAKERVPASPSTTSEAARAQASSADEYKAGMEQYAAGRYPLAVEHFRKAAEQGNPDAQYYTGLLFANGDGVKQSWSEAAKWYHKAAERNQPDALTQLGRLYVTGVGVGKVNLQKGADLFARAAEAYPAGEKRNQVLQQREALLKAMAAPAEEE